MKFLRQSTSVDLPVGPFIDETDGITAMTALTITQPDIRLKKNAAAWAQKNASQTLSHEENGNYEVTLDATDTNTLGHLRLHIHEGGALPVWDDFMVIPAATYDALFGTGVEEPSGVFTWPGNPFAILGWLGACATNPITEVSNEATLRDRADTTDLATIALADDTTTFERGPTT